MKKTLFLALFCACCVVANAQLSDGSTAPDFTVYEIDKDRGVILSNNPYTLYQYTDSGKLVYLDFFATWCGPCWSYHTSGALESLYSQYGPNGTDEVMTFGIEGSYGNYASLSNTGADLGGNASQGNWLNGVLYPIIPTRMSPNTQAVVNSYSISYYPTVYVVCPHRVVYEIGQQDAPTLYAAKTDICRPYDSSVETNAILVRNSIAKELDGINDAYICSATATPKVSLQNVGSTAITSADFLITLDGQTSTYSWTGNLANKYDRVTVNLPQITVDGHGDHSYSVVLTNTNGVAEVDTNGNKCSFDFFVSSDVTTEDVVEDFSNLSSPWFFDHQDYFDVYNGSLYFYAYGIDQGEVGSLYTPMMDLTHYTNPTLKFDLAHRRYSSYTERLQVQSSSNCGTNWSTLYNKAGANLATVTGSTTSLFIPTASQWRTETVDLSGIEDKSAVTLKFRFTSGYGNLVWIDNVRICEGVGVEENEMEMSIYPNPVSDVLYVNSSAPVKDVQIFNMQGQVVRAISGDVHEISVADLADGVYMMKVTTEAGNVTNQKIVKQ